MRHFCQTGRSGQKVKRSKLPAEEGLARGESATQRRGCEVTVSDRNKDCETEAVRVA